MLLDDDDDDDEVRDRVSGNCKYIYFYIVRPTIGH